MLTGEQHPQWNKRLGSQELVKLDTLYGRDLASNAFDDMYLQGLGAGQR